MKKTTVFWFRRDLRLVDNAGLSVALAGDWDVLPVFIFDKDILEGLEDKCDLRVNFIYQEVDRLKNVIESTGGRLEVLYARPIDAFKDLTAKYQIAAVITNRDYEPYALARDKEVEQYLSEKGIGFITCKDQVIFEKGEVLKEDGKPYTVFTPYSKKWKASLPQKGLPEFPSEKKLDRLLKDVPLPMPTLSYMGFQETTFDFPEKTVENALLKSYADTRNLPAVKGTSQLGLHLRFGTISIRHLVKNALETSETFLNELIWREFFQMILWHFPNVVTECFKPQYEQVPWRNDLDAFQAWCDGQTGYPLVDAGMRELNATGFMHNRVRMVAASFLTKHLLIDWRWGEAYFAAKLLDYELASNNGNWQWAAGTGCDAAPYFRIFNPESQAKKFDPEEQYIKKWVPEIGSSAYPAPIVEHTFARARALDAYKLAVSEKVQTHKRQ